MASHSNNSNIIDSLPYVDKEVDIPGLKELAKAEIERELVALNKEHAAAGSSKKGKGKQSAVVDVEQLLVEQGRMPAEVEMFSRSKHLSELLDLQSDPQLNPLSSQSSNPAIDPRKYVLPDLQAQEDYEPTEDDWRDLERRVRVGLEHMAVRNANASLLSSYAPNHWLIRNFQLEAEAKELEKEVEVWKEKVVDVNRGRRLYQEATGKHLATLESRWQDLVTSTIQLELANNALGGEVEMLRQRARQLEMELEQK